MSVFVSFNEFRDRVDDAKAGHYRETIADALRRKPVRPALAATAVEPTDDVIEAEFAKMHAFVKTRNEHISNVKHTFLGPGNNFYDCVPFEEQPTYRAAKVKNLNPAIDHAKIKPLSLLRPAQIDPKAFQPVVYRVLPPLRRQLVDQFGKSLECPDGCVPLRRVTIDQLAALGKFEKFFRKSAPPIAFPYVVGSNGEIHHHAVCEDTTGGPYFGCSTWLNVWEVDPSPGVFSLSQLWLIGSVDPPANPLQYQTIESGWQTYTQMNGTPSPVLFVFYNPDGYGPRSGYLSNQQHLGFVQAPNSGWIIGDAMPQPYSTTNGDQRGNQMQWQIDDQGNWLLYFGPGGDEPPTLLGWFPAGLYDGGTLAKSGQILQFGGEVCSPDPGQVGYPNTGKMGSGLAPFLNADGTLNATDSFREAAFQKQIAVCTTAGAPMVPAQLRVATPDPHDVGYSAGQITNSASDDWGSFMFYGGAHSN